MMRRRRGSIVNVTSVVGLRGNPGQANYASSKAGLIGLTKSLARELGSRGVRVNAIAPGYVATALTEVLNDEQRGAIFTNTPLGRLGARRTSRAPCASLRRRGVVHHRRGDLGGRWAGDVSSVTDEITSPVMNTPLGRLGSPEDIAGAVRFLCADEASFITGEVISVDGGLGDVSSVTDENGRKRVVITGVGGVTPLGCDMETTWKNVLAGESGAGPITLFDNPAITAAIPVSRDRVAKSAAVAGPNARR